MSAVREALAQIDEFVGLAMERRRRALPMETRARLETLEEAIRDAIDGAKPAPKRIANPSPARGPGAPAAAPAKVSSAPTPPAGAKLSGALEDVLQVSNRDKKKLSEVRLEDLPVSSYTPPLIPAFMSDYFSADLVPARLSGGAALKRVISSDGEQVDLSKETKVLLGLEKPSRPAPASGPVRSAAAAPPSSAPSVSRSQAAAPAEAADDGMPVIVHLLQGGTQRGAVEFFDPAGTELEFADGHSLPFREVLAVFFGLRKGETPTPSQGQQVVVKLVNDKQVSGLTNDYEEGAMALTVVPEPRRGNIDRIWVPAWAVKGIEI